MYTINGTLRYDPVLNTNKSSSTISENHTLIIELPLDDTTDYYQWLVKRQYGLWLKLQPPMWGSHVTVIKHNEHVPDLSDWFLFEGESIALDIDNIFLERHWQFWSLSVYSNRLLEIRSFYGLPTDFRLHTTIGRQFDWQPRVLIPGVIHDIDYYSDIDKLGILDDSCVNFEPY